MNIFISGSLAYDRIMDFPGKFEDHILPEKIHILNVSFEVNGLTERFGGTAGNIAYSLALLGERPTILASAGKDFDQYEAWLRDHDLPLDGIRIIDEEFTAGAYITTDRVDNQITGFNPGAMKYPSLYTLDKADPKKTLGIISPGNIEDMLVYSRQYKKFNIPYIFDPGQQIPVLPHAHLAEIITGSEILISNDYELEMIVKATDLEKNQILEHARALITTLGEEGSIVYTRKDEEEIPAVKAERVSDPTGAGDAFRSGLLKGLVTGKDLAVSAALGATCASFAIEIQGTQAHRFSTEQFRERYEKHFGPIE